MRTLKFLALIGMLAILSAIAVGIFFSADFITSLALRRTQTSLPGRSYTSALLRLIATLPIVHRCRSMIPQSFRRGRKLIPRGDASIVTAVLASSEPNSWKDYILTLPTLKR